MFFAFPEDARWSTEPAGRRVRRRDRRVPRRCPGPAAGAAAASAQGGLLPSAVLRRTTSSGPALRASPSGSCAGAS
jgi:hypothetical protein